MWRGETGFRYNDYYTSLAGIPRAVALMSDPGDRVMRVRSLD